MPEIRFYHLTRGGIMSALPQLLGKGLQSGRRIIVRVADDKAAEKIATDLWAFDKESFLPHGTKSDGHAADHPIWITPGNDNPNGATMLLTLGAPDPIVTDGFDLICDVFDGADEMALTAARARWAALKDADITRAYYQQTDSGWEKKA